MTSNLPAIKLMAWHSRKIMRIFSVIIALTVAVLAICTRFASAKECDGENLPSDGKLRIGVKYRPEDCPVKSKNGDK